MATNKPRFSVTFTDESFNKIQKYQKENNISTQSKAVARLVELAISEIELGCNEKNSPSAAEAAPGDEQEKGVMRLVSELTPDQQEFLLAWLKTTIELRRQKPPSPQE